MNVAIHNDVLELTGIANVANHDRDHSLLPIHSSRYLHSDNRLQEAEKHHDDH